MLLSKLNMLNMHGTNLNRQGGIHAKLLQSGSEARTQPELTSAKARAGKLSRAGVPRNRPPGFVDGLHPTQKQTLSYFHDRMVSEFAAIATKVWILLTSGT